MRKSLLVLAFAIIAGPVLAQPQAVGSGRFLRFNHVNGDVVSQIDFPTAEFCRATYEVMLQAVGAGFKWGGANVSCTSVDSAPLLPYRTVLFDGFLGSQLRVNANLEDTCVEWTQIYLAAKMPASSEFRYSVREPCKSNY